MALRLVRFVSLFVFTALLVVGGMVRVRADLPEAVDFNFHIKPILSDRCYTCHGPDSNNREGDLRLDTKEGAYAALEDGEASHIIKPGVPEQSELYRRIASTDENERMPPADSNVSLSPEEIELFRRWIEQGAQWKSHWSFLPLKDTPVPDVQNGDWPVNEIDHFILARLEQEGLQPAAEASQEQLVRRLSYDLTGLPPTLKEVDAQLADPDAPGSETYEQLVDRLLASPRHGERMAVDWLDLARYADTFGYQSDVYRPVWPWRDWVIQAFNDNLPYDEFITWQLAGDLLPNATREQQLATTFNRLHRQTNEGGSIEEEFRAGYVADRTDTLGTAFLGLTLGCARCHDHKYDPITQKEYYQLFSYFNSIDESGLYSHFTNATPTPTLLLSSLAEQQQMDEVEQQIREAELQIDRVAEQANSAFNAWLAKPTAATAPSGLVGDFGLETVEKNQTVNRADPEHPGKLADSPQIVPGKFGNGLKFSGENNFSTDVGGDFTRNDPFSISLWINTPDVKERAVLFHRSRAWTDAASRGYQLLIEYGQLSASLIHFWPGNAIRIRTQRQVPTGQWVHVAVTYDGSSRADGLKIFVDGSSEPCKVVRDHLFKNITYGEGDIAQKSGEAHNLTLAQRFRDRGFKDGLIDELKIFNRELASLEVAQLFDGSALDRLLAMPASERSDEQTRSLLEYYLHRHSAEYAESLSTLREFRQRRSERIDSIPEIMVMHDLPTPRPTFLLSRGAYDAPADAVQPNTPASLTVSDTHRPPNRLGMAQWLTDPGHPLTARVAVNRFWQAMFGHGLVATPEDFGSQGQLPSHPELLDWLTQRFIDSGWDVKALFKLMAMSATYRQSANCSEEQRAADPGNVLLAHGSRYRLSAEMIRDGLLLTSGLLVEKLGGPPVKPYQPPGLWKEKGKIAYQRDEGANSHRRSLYTYWKRTSPPPAMMTLDAAKRDVCVAKRQTTATPLQSLVLLNGPQYVEISRALAQRAMLEGDNTLDGRITFVFRALTSRRPTSQELQVLTQLYQEQLLEFQARPADAEEFLDIGDHRRDESLAPAELAAMTVLAETVLNLDATVTKR